MAATKTDNSFFADKVALRLNHLKIFEKKNKVNVLDVYGGTGKIWGAVRREIGNKIIRTGIDKRTDITAFHLHGDNYSILSGIDLTKFDVIDLDAYGIPAKELEIVLSSKFSGVVFVTAIQTGHGGLPFIISEQIGLPAAAMKEAPSIISRRGVEYLKEWLAIKGIKKIYRRYSDKGASRRNYFCFYTSDVAVAEGHFDTLPGETVAGLS